MNDAIWHKCPFPFWPIKRGPNGRMFLLAHNGQVWRRRVNGQWQYTQDDQTFAEWERTIL